MINMILQKITGIKYFIHVSDTAKIEEIGTFDMQNLIKLCE
jgi:hypothetical protein